MDKEILQITSEDIEDVLYIGCVRAMQLKYSSPKFAVYEEPEKKRYRIHSVFPFAGKVGIVSDNYLDIKTFHKKPFSVFLDVMVKLQHDIIDTVNEKEQEEQEIDGEDE